VKILVVHSELGLLRGGGENFTRNLFLAFAERGHDISATFVANAKGHYPLELPAKIRPMPLAGFWSRKLGQKALSNMAHCLPRGTKPRTQWDRLQEAICWRTIRWHDRRFSRRIEAEFCGRWKDFDAVYVHGNADVLFEIREFLGEHAVEIPVGLDTEVFKPGPSSVRQRLGWTKNNWVVGYVGRLAYIKGIDLLAYAFRELRKNIPHARLIIVGSGEEDGKLRSVLNGELQEGIAHIEPDVPHHFLAEWYRAMDLFVMPSRYENCSNAVLEALACGVPFLGSDVRGNRRLAESEAGWLFAKGSADSLVKAIASIAGNSCSAKDRGVLCGEKVRQAYSWETSAKRLEDILLSSLDRKVQASCRP
jgi:glycosyltransferase involved in cell wall biosynthesis